jgi:hydrogenase-4 membrane subunit HyfE
MSSTWSAPLAVSGLVLLALSSASIVSRDPRQMHLLYALAALPQAAIAAILGAAFGHPELYALAAALLVVKGLAAPRLLVVRWPAAERSRYALSGHLGTPATLVGVIGVLLFAFRVAAIVAPARFEAAVAACLAAGLVGLCAPAVRHELAAQSAGLLHAEAGLSSAALLLVGHLPLVPDVIALAELLVLALALGLLLGAVARVHGRADARHLATLRG